MSGLEIAGLVLGAFPVAIGVLGIYKEAAKRLRFWYRISAEHKICDAQLGFHLVEYRNNLKNLLLPVAGLDDKHIDDLLKDPTGKCWAEARTSAILKERLGDSWEIYLQCISEFREWMEAMNRELAFDVATRQLSCDSTPGASFHHDIYSVSFTTHADKFV